MADAGIKEGNACGVDAFVEVLGTRLLYEVDNRVNSGRCAQVIDVELNGEVRQASQSYFDVLIDASMCLLNSGDETLIDESIPVSNGYRNPTDVIEASPSRAHRAYDIRCTAHRSNPAQHKRTHAQQGKYTQRQGGDARRTNHLAPKPRPAKGYFKSTEALEISGNVRTPNKSEEHAVPALTTSRDRYTSPSPIYSTRMPVKSDQAPGAKTHGKYKWMGRASDPAEQGETHTKSPTTRITDPHSANPKPSRRTVGTMRRIDASYNSDSMARVREKGDSSNWYASGGREKGCTGRKETESLEDEHRHHLPSPMNQHNHRPHTSESQNREPRANPQSKNQRLRRIGAWSLILPIIGRHRAGGRIAPIHSRREEKETSKEKGERHAKQSANEIHRRETSPKRNPNPTAHESKHNRRPPLKSSPEISSTGSESTVSFDTWSHRAGDSSRRSTRDGAGKGRRRGSEKRKGSGERRAVRVVAALDVVLPVLLVLGHDGRTIRRVRPVGHLALYIPMLYHGGEAIVEKEASKR
ncbi:hypothetical protein DFP72DRAFT_860970 [Ephemerocybe angulata]|uniref:Uncharacterized protein n=1 Tax=Ephemerocybe angulata TaxID=980116 RepID=A0A8H6HA78_9AGAR|nr:hypothetical protein DFP72DRAFT_860970 [Tulosesus angulatus]